MSTEAGKLALTEKLIPVTNAYTREVLELAMADSTLNREQVELVLSMKGLQGETLKTATDNIMLARSEDVARTSTDRLSHAMRGLKKRMSEFIAAHPWLTLAVAITAATAALVAFWKANTLSVEEAKENIENYTSKINNLKTEIEELETIDTRTADEEARLNYLKQQVEIQERLLEIENQRLATSRERGSGWFGLTFGKSFSETGSYADQEAMDNGWLSGFHADSIPRIISEYTQASLAADRLKKSMDEAFASGDTDAYNAAATDYLEQMDKMAGAYSRALTSLSNYRSMIDQKQADLAAGYYGVEGSFQYNEAIADIHAYENEIQKLMTYIGDYETRTASGHTVFDYIIEKSGIAQDKLIELAQTDGINLEDQSAEWIAFAKSVEEAGIPILDMVQYLLSLKKANEEAANAADRYSPIDIFATEDTEGELTTLGKISEEIDKIQNAYKTLSDAIAEYDENGAISIDTLQDVINLGDNWMDYVDAETGALKLDKEALQELTASRLNDLRVQALTNLAQNVEGIYDDIRAKQFLTATNYDTAKSYEALAESMAKVSFVKLDEAVQAGKLSLKNAHLVKQKYLKDQKTLNALFDNVSITDWGIGGSSSDSSSSTSQFEETYDFFEDRINNLNDAYELLETNIENVNGAVAKNNLINAQYDIAAEKLNNYNDALDMYKQKANEALSSIPADMVDDVVSGAVKITDFIGDGNKEVVEAIKDYNSWADKVSEVTAEIAALQEEMRQLELTKFNNIAEQFDSMFDVRSGAIDNIQKQVDLLETAGQVIGEAFYTEAIAQTEKQIDILNEKRVALANQLADSLASGRIQVGTDEWLEMVNTITEVEGSILDAKKSVEEFNNSIQELHWDNLERVSDAFDGIADELSNISDLYDDMDVASKDGAWSDEGLTQLGMAAQQYELARYEAEMYGQEIEQLKKDYAEGKYSATEYAEKLAELNGLQWDSVQAAEDAKDAMVDLNQARVDIIIEGIEEEIEAYEKLTQAKIDELEAERDLKNYRDQLADQTKTVADLEKQLAAMANDNTAATQAKRKQLEEQLAEAKKNLADTEYDHSIDEQTEALNKQLEEFTETKESEIDELEAYMKDTERVISDSFETVKKNADKVGAQLELIAKKHGVVISDTIINSWKSGETAVASYGQTLTAQTSVFTANLVTVQSGIFQLQAQANITAQSIAGMFGVSADKLINEMQKSYNSAWNVNNMMNALRDSAISTLERGYDVSSIVNSLNTVIGKTNEAINTFGDWLEIQGQELPAGKGGGSSSSNSVGKGYTNKVSVSMKYASGTKNAKAGWAEVDEEGDELKFVTIGNKKYQLMNAGDQVIPHDGTERLWAWSKIDPVEFAKKLKENKVRNVSYFGRNKKLMPYPDIIHPTPSPVITIDNLVNVNGSINNDNLKQMQATAEKAVNSAFKRFTDEVRKAGGFV